MQIVERATYVLLVDWIQSICALQGGDDDSNRSLDESKSQAQTTTYSLQGNTQVKSRQSRFGRLVWDQALSSRSSHRGTICILLGADNSRNWPS